MPLHFLPCDKSGFQEPYKLQRVEQFGSQVLPALQWPGQCQELAELPLGGQLVFQLQAVGTGWVPEEFLELSEPWQWEWFGFSI